MDAVSTTTISVPRQSWNFARHFLEMCVAMCIGGTVLYLLIFTLTPGHVRIFESTPRLS